LSRAISRQIGSKVIIGLRRARTQPDTRSSYFAYILPIDKGQEELYIFLDRLIGLHRVEAVKFFIVEYHVIGEDFKLYWFVPFRASDIERSEQLASNGVVLRSLGASLAPDGT
jgi:hypothetical protein